jgi:hypothetical protein
METTTKIDVRAMKADIKKMNEEQKFYVNQRKTKRLVGERVINPSEAQWKHRSNRQKLRLMYAAYTLARGKSISLIDKHPEQIEDEAFKILAKYEIQVPVETIEQ